MANPKWFNFQSIIYLVLKQYVVHLALIGEHWETYINHPPAHSRDFVVWELAEAHKLGLAIIPIHLGIIRKIANLPLEIEFVNQLQAMTLREDPDFEGDVAGLIKHIKALQIINPGKPISMYTQLRLQLLTRNDKFALQRLKWQIESLLSTKPFDIEARELLQDVQRAITFAKEYFPTEFLKAPAKLRPKINLLIVAGLVLAFTFLLVSLAWLLH